MVEVNIPRILRRKRITREELQQIVKDLEKMSKMDFDDIRREDLVQIRDVKINVEEPLLPRLLRYLHKVKNPYYFLVDDTIVKVSFNPAGVPLDVAFQRHLDNDTYSW